MLRHRYICKEALPSRADTQFKSQQNQVHFLLHSNSRKNTPQSMKHLLRTSYAQGVPATGNYLHCKINLFTLVCVCRACLHPPQLPLDSTTTAAPQREGFAEAHRTDPLLATKTFTLQSERSSSEAVLSVFT